MNILYIPKYVKQTLRRARKLIVVSQSPPLNQSLRDMQALIDKISVNTIYIVA